MAELNPDDEVTLIAVITVRYSGERGSYRADETAPLPTNDRMAALDQQNYDDGDVSVEDVVSWAAGSRDIAVTIKAE